MIHNSDIDRRQVNREEQSRTVGRAFGDKVTVFLTDVGGRRPSSSMTASLEKSEDVRRQLMEGWLYNLLNNVGKLDTPGFLS